MAIKDIAGGITEDFELKAELEAESSSNSSILLSMGERVQDVRVTKSVGKGVSKAQSLQRPLWSLIEVILGE